MNKERKRDIDAALVDRLVRGDEAAWLAFVERFSAVIYGAIHKRLGPTTQSGGEATDVAQDVFLRLCKDEFRLLKRYEPNRASLSTWLTVVATSTTLDFLRKRRGYSVPLEDAPAEAVAIAPQLPPEKLKIPDGLLSPRQALVMNMLFDHDMDVAEVAETLGIDRQTVRSTQHKALVKLRAHFAEEA